MTKEKPAPVKYVHQAYPTTLYHPVDAPNGRTVATEKEAKALGSGWYDTPAKFPKEKK